MLARYIRLVQRTSTWVPSLGDFEAELIHAQLVDNQPFIFAMWHGQFLLLPLLYLPDLRVRAMVARHGDAEVIGAMLQEFGMDLIRGAGAGGRKKDRGGAHAFRAAQEAIREGVTVAMTADVPPGPARRAGMGIVTLARLTGRPVIPVAIASSRYKAFDTWSKMTLNLPYSRCGVAAGEPIYVPADVGAKEVEGLRLSIEAGLNEVTRLAYERAGAADPFHPVIDPLRRPGIALGSYRAVTAVLRPAAPLLLGHRARRGKEDPARRHERLGHASRPRPDRTLIWIHAASVGEINAILPLMAELANQRPDVTLLLTTGTVTSAELAARRLPEGAIHQYAPLDSVRHVDRFLDHWRPDLGLFVESEIWPNLLLESARRAIPLALINGRMSKRSFEKWRRSPVMARGLFSRFAVILAQTPAMERRFAQLGGRDVRVAGNLKIDAPPPPVDELELHRLKRMIGERPVFLAASTHDGEERIIAEAYQQVEDSAKQRPLAIIVPRHPDRAPAIAKLMQQAGLPAARRSAGEAPDGSHAVYIADTMGELGTFFALAPITFIGGSLVRHGGQNPIEPVRLGAGVLTGPYTENFKEIFEELVNRQGCRRVTSASELAAAITALHGDPTALATMTANARAALAGMSGALERTLAAIDRLLPDTARAQRAS